MPAADDFDFRNDEMVPLPIAAGIAYAHISGAAARRTDDDLRLVSLALSKVAPVYLGLRPMDAQELEERLMRPHASLEGLRVRGRDLRAATSAMKESLLLSALRLLQSRTAVAYSRHALQRGRSRAPSG